MRWKREYEEAQGQKFRIGGRPRIIGEEASDGAADAAHMSGDGRLSCVCVANICRQSPAL